MSILAVITGQTLVTFFIWIVVAGLIYWVLNWVLTQVALPEPFAKIARVVLVLIVAVLIINALLLFVGHPFIVIGG